MAFGKRVKRSKTAKRNTKDNIRGFGAMPSDVYDFTIAKAYIFESDGGAMFFKLELKPSNGGRALKVSECFQSGDEKGNQIFYTDTNGDEQDMIGYTKLNDLLITALGDDAFNDDDEPMDIFDFNDEGDVEKKKIKLYDYVTKKEVPTKVPVIVPLIGKKVKLGVTKVIEFKTATDSEGKFMYRDGKAVPSDETREINEVNFYFDSEGFSANELIAQEDTPSSIDDWMDNYAGKEIDRTKGKAGKSKAGSKRKPLKNKDIFND